MVHIADDRQQYDPPARHVADVPGAGRFQHASNLGAWQLIAIGAAIVLLGILFAGFIRLVFRPLALFFAAIIIAEALSPLVDRMSRRMPRTLAVVIPYVCLLAVISGVAFLIFPTLVEEAQQLVDRAPELIDKFQTWINDLDPTGAGRVTQMLTDRLGTVAGALSGLPFAIVSSIVQVLLVIAMSIYFLIAKPALHRFVVSLVPDARREQASDILGELGTTIGGYVRAQLIAGLVIGLLAYAGLWVIGVAYVLVLAVISGLGEVVPIVGPILSAIPAIAVALLHSPTQALIVAGFFIVLQQVESNVLQPNLIKSQADIPPLLVLFSLFVGGTLGGILGALIAVPLAGAMKVIVVRVVAPALRQWSGASQPSDAPVDQETA